MMKQKKSKRRQQDKGGWTPWAWDLLNCSLGFSSYSIIDSIWKSAYNGQDENFHFKSQTCALAPLAGMDVLGVHSSTLY